mmetsp:Transcript_27607/g.55708  ORF Transcript_27607/g.55708 Transcript_27607/m.55708 type:complete len:624 (-) Transcript_27607:512-2383(-)
MNRKFVNLELFSTVGARHTVWRSHLSEIRLENLISGQDDIILLHHLARRYRLSIRPMIRTHRQCSILRKFLNLRPPLSQGDDRTNHQCSGSSSSVFGPDFLHHFQHVHFVLPIHGGFVPESLLFVTFFHIVCGWVFGTRFAVLKFRSVVENCCNRLERFAHAHLIGENSTSTFRLFHLLMTHPTESFHLKRQQGRTKSLRLLPNLPPKTLLHQLIRLQLLHLLSNLLLAHLHLRLQPLQLFLLQTLPLLHVLSARHILRKNRAFQMTKDDVAWLSPKEGAVTDANGAFFDAFVAGAAGGAAGGGVFDAEGGGLVEGAVSVGLSSFGSGSWSGGGFASCRVGGAFGGFVLRGFRCFRFGFGCGFGGRQFAFVVVVGFVASCLGFGRLLLDSNFGSSWRCLCLFHLVPFFGIFSITGCENQFPSGGWFLLGRWCYALLQSGISLGSPRWFERGFPSTRSGQFLLRPFGKIGRFGFFHFNRLFGEVGRLFGTFNARILRFLLGFFCNAGPLASFVRPRRIFLLLIWLGGLFSLSGRPSCLRIWFCYCFIFFLHHQLVLRIVGRNVLDFHTITASITTSSTRLIIIHGKGFTFRRRRSHPHRLLPTAPIRFTLFFRVALTQRGRGNR